MISIDDLKPGTRFAVANQGTAITFNWAVVKVIGVHGDDVRYERPPMRAIRTTPIERFLEIVNADPKGPHHTPKPEV